jgi:cytochrome c oxidase subunit 4
VTQPAVPERVIAPRTYVLVCGGLLLLTATTVGLAQVNLHGWNTLVGLGIAALKVLLIGLFFMHLRVSSGLTRLVAIAALAWLAILLAGTLDDLLTRAWLGVPGK